MHLAGHSTRPASIARCRSSWLLAPAQSRLPDSLGRLNPARKENRAWNQADHAANRAITLCDGWVEANLRRGGLVIRGESPGASQGNGSFSSSSSGSVRHVVRAWLARLCRLACGSQRSSPQAARANTSSNSNKHPSLTSHLTHPHFLRHRIPFWERTGNALRVGDF